MVTKEQECLEIVEACKKTSHSPSGRPLQPQNQTAYRWENYWWHSYFANSYVRGNWGCEDESTFSLLSKSWISFSGWLAGENKVTCISPFNRANKPAEAADANSCLEKKCPYSASRIYLGEIKQGETGWPVNAPDIESITDALTRGPYMVAMRYECDNDVANHEVFWWTKLSCSHRKICQRYTKVYGTRGELTSEDGISLTRFDFATKTRYPWSKLGHDGADFSISSRGGGWRCKSYSGRSSRYFAQP